MSRRWAFVQGLVHYERLVHGFDIHLLHLQKFSRGFAFSTTVVRDVLVQGRSLGIHFKKLVNLGFGVGHGGVDGPSAKSYTVFHSHCFHIALRGKFVSRRSCEPVEGGLGRRG